MDTRSQPPFMPIAAPADSLPQSLPDVLDAVWTAIEGGVRDRWTPWGLPMLVTSDRTGAPHARVLALRGFDRDARTLLFHTDGRSDKVTHLTNDPRAAVTFWHPGDAVEVRMTGAATVHRNDAIAHEAWKQASPLSKSAAAIALAPGTRIGRPTPFAELVQEGDAKLAFAHFVALAFVAEAIDWLWVGANDLRRARFSRMGAAWAGSWIVP